MFVIWNRVIGTIRIFKKLLRHSCIHGKWNRQEKLFILFRRRKEYSVRYETKRMESKYFQIERSRIEYHRSHGANNIVVCFQIKKERNSIYLSTLIPYSSILPCTRFNFTSKEITEERGRQRNQCTPSITFIPSIKLWFDSSRAVPARPEWVTWSRKNVNGVLGRACGDGRREHWPFTDTNFGM